MIAPQHPAARRVVEAFLAGEPQSAGDLLAEDVVFHSPVRDYAGAERVVAVWRALAAVLRAARLTALHEADGEAAAFFAAVAAEQPADGVLRVVTDADDRVTEVTLMLRPLAALRAGIARMGPPPDQPDDGTRTDPLALSTRASAPRHSRQPDGPSPTTS